jgi:hypothetical protein
MDIEEYKRNEERYKEFIRMHETIIQHLKSDNEMHRQRVIDLEKKIQKFEKTVEDKREIANYDKFMISFRKEAPVI